MIADFTDEMELLTCGIQANRLASLSVDGQRGRSIMAVYHNYGIMIAISLVCPLHTSHEIVELVRIETPFIADGYAAHRLLPTGP